MSRHNKSSQKLSISDASIAGNVGQAGERLIQVQGRGKFVFGGDNNVITYSEIIQISVDEIKTRPFEKTSPYKGLKSFEPNDKDKFFGRHQFLAELVNKLEHTNLVLLLGASGSGKSSLVGAGLIPWLSQKLGNQWVNLTLRPDKDPFKALYGSLLGARFKQSEVEFVTSGDDGTLNRLVSSLKQPDSFWFIFVDQFEELFTVSDPEKRDRFIKDLAKLCKDYAGDPTLKIVATMRSDFLDKLDAAPANELAVLTENYRPLLTQMHSDELRLAIEQPAAHHGVVFEKGLVERIIKEVQGQAGYLPLMQYTLDLLWKIERELEEKDGGLDDRTLNIKSYDAIGGVRGALQKRVDQIHQSLSKEEQTAMQRIFLRLVGIGGNSTSETDWRPIRKRELRSRFADPLEKKVLVQLIDANLLVSDASKAETESEATVEIAHEVLLTSWNRLEEWITENREAIALRNRLNEDVRQWKVTQRDEELWSGIKLEKAVKLRDDLTFNQVLGGFGPDATEFLMASVGLRDKQEREEEERQ
ncbi:MAG: hypothetical protein AAF152_14325 [Cyanobacteria bacterium P01_A01_bin.114]